MNYLTIALLCLTLVSGSIVVAHDYEDLTPEEIQQVFHTDIVPEHEFVKLHLSKRSANNDTSAKRQMHIRVFGENISLWLHPGDSILAGQDTPVYHAHYSPDKPGNVEFVQWHGIFREMVGCMYQNITSAAFFIVGQEESGNAQVNGYIGSRRLVVRSLPTRVAEEYRKRRQSIGDFDDADSSVHVVFPITENNEKDFSVQSLNAAVLRQRITRSSSENIPDILYPEVLVVVEHSISRTYGTNIYGLLLYILAFMHGVELKYRSVESPKIRFHISGIILADDIGATPYISNNSLGLDVFNISQALKDSSKFFYAVKNTFPLGSYDIALTITGQNCGDDDNGRAILGIAWPGVLCYWDDGLKTFYSVTIVKDNGAFKGVHPAAHEIGHIIGAQHDHNTTGTECSSSKGYLMSSAVTHTKKSSDFSICSMNAINRRLRLDLLMCLYNPPPSAGRKLPELFPGKIKNLNEQCESLNRKDPCQNPNGVTDICVEIFCKKADGSCRRTNTAAVDGTTCGDRRICLHMECVSIEDLP